jgi:hypothetical protein
LKQSSSAMKNFTPVTGSRRGLNDSREKLIVIMPAYNAEKTLRQTFAELPHEYVDEVILVDDASLDRTAVIARELGITTIIHAENRGVRGKPEDLLRRGAPAGRGYRGHGPPRLPVFTAPGNRDGLHDHCGDITTWSWVRAFSEGRPGRAACRCISMLRTGSSRSWRIWRSA